MSPKDDINLKYSCKKSPNSKLLPHGTKAALVTGVNLVYLYAYFYTKELKCLLNCQISEKSLV